MLLLQLDLLAGVLLPPHAVLANKVERLVVRSQGRALVI